MYDRILVDPITQEEKTVTGLYIPDTAKEKPVKGKVVAVGHGYRNQDGEISALNVQVGDTVLYAKWSGNEIKVDDKNMIIMKESDVLAIIN